jgi:hypothetical protein
MHLNESIRDRVSIATPRLLGSVLECQIGVRCRSYPVAAVWPSTHVYRPSLFR